MTSQANRQVRLKSRPAGIPQADNFEIVTAPLPDIAENQFLVRNEYLSVEPAMRGWVSAVANYSTPVGIGDVMRAFSAGKIVASRHPNYREGDAVMGMLGWQEYAISDGSTITQSERKGPATLAVAWGSWAERRHGLFRLARRRPTAPRRHRGCFDCGGGGRASKLHHHQFGVH